jgi:hypothetical protein
MCVGQNSTTLPPLFGHARLSELILQIQQCDNLHTECVKTYSKFENAIFAAVYFNSVVFWDVTQLRFVRHRRFRTTYRSHLRGSNVQYNCFDNLFPRHELFRERASILSRTYNAFLVRTSFRSGTIFHCLRTSAARAMRFCDQQQVSRRAP